LLNPMRMAVAILGGTPMSKLFLNVREKKSLCYYCAARFDRTKGIMMIDSGVEHDKIDEAKKAILEQLQEVCPGDFTDADIEFAALNLQNNFHSIGESAYALELFYLTQTVLGISETPEQQSEQIAKVTREQIIAAANQIHLSTVYLLTDDDTQNGKEEIGA
ncbi:MAG: insulinase family protein, partial [Oscillospiraceae bacterium]